MALYYKEMQTFFCLFRCIVDCAAVTLPYKIFTYAQTGSVSLVIII